MSKKHTNTKPPQEKEKYFTAFLYGFIIIFTPLIILMSLQQGYFVYYGDFNAQQIPFYNLANDAVRNNDLGWNWFTDLGCDFMTSYSFYLFGSPFFRLTTLLPRDLVSYSIPVLLALKHGIASLTAYAYIRRFVRNKNASLAGALMYSYSGFQLFNIFFNHFHDVTALFPLMLIAMEECINNRRKGVFALTVAIMAINNYYFFTGQAVFLILYFLFRVFCSDFDISLKKFFGLFFEAIAGTMAAAFVLLPSALAIMGNYRVSEHLSGIDMVIYSDKTLIPRIIQTFFMPPDVAARPNLFHSDFEKWASIGGFLPLFSMSGVIVFMKNKRRHWASRLFLCCIIFSFIPILNSLFQAGNGYYYARWFYMPILIMAMMTAYSLDDAEADNMFGLKICAVFTAAFMIIGVLPVKKDEKLVFFELPEYVGYFWAQAAITVLCLIGAYSIYRRKKKMQPYLDKAAAFTAAASLICSFTIILYGAAETDLAEKYINTAVNGKDKVYEEVSDDNFFRIDISEDCDNYPMFWGLPNMRAFQSVVTTSIMDFYESVGVHRDVASRADISHYTIRGLLSVKYYYKEIIDDVTYDDLISGNYSIPEDYDESKNTDYTIIPEKLEGFEYVGENGRFEIYENKHWIPMGFAYDTFLPRERADKLANSARERIMMDSLIFEDAEHEEKYSDYVSECEIKEPAKTTKDDYIRFCDEKRENCSSSFTYDEHGFKSGITLEKPMMVFFSVPYSDGWTAEVNGKETEIAKVDDGFMAVPAEEGENTIVFRYRTPGLDTGIIISITGIALLAVYIAACRIFGKKNGKMRHTHYYDYESSRRISAHEQYCRSFGISDEKEK